MFAAVILITNRPHPLAASAKKVDIMCNRPVLFVDDDLISRLLNCAILRESGFVVVEARSYAEACSAIERNPQLSALVTDIDLGAGPDGFEIARQARLAAPQLPVIYMSGTEHQRYDKEGVRDSCFIAKPFQPAQIVRALDDAPLAPNRLDRESQARI